MSIVEVQYLWQIHVWLENKHCPIQGRFTYRRTVAVKIEEEIKSRNA